MINKVQMQIEKILSLIEAEGLEGPGYTRAIELAKRPGTSEPFKSLQEFAALLEIKAQWEDSQTQIELFKVSNLAAALHYLYE